ncbi:MAG TPA: L,D-transpeptidase, partial [Oscillatoriaceae cyanobacterium]
MLPRSRTFRIAALAALVLTLGAGVARAETELDLLPGSVSGQIVPYRVHRYDRLADIALRYRVNPVRVEYAGRLYWGKLVHVDSRAIVPTFPSSLSGIVLNLPEAEVYYVLHGHLIHRYPVAVAREDKPVPLGDTQVVSMDVNPTWVVPESIQAEMAKAGQHVITEIPPGPDDPLGPRFIGFWNGRFGFH